MVVFSLSSDFFTINRLIGLQKKSDERNPETKVTPA